jgi:hypothetical protein
MSITLGPVLFGVVLIFVYASLSIRIDGLREHVEKLEKELRELKYE